MAARATPSQKALAGWGLSAIGVLVAVFFLAMASTSYDVWGGVVLAPILIAVSMPALARQARQEGKNRLFWFLLLALVLKLAGAVARHYVAFDVYGGTADATGYHSVGVELSEQFRGGDFDTELKSVFDTDFIRILTGVIYTIIGPGLLGGFLFYSWLGFWGLFFFYKAFVMAVPEGRTLTYGRLVFFLPSLIFWPSSIGKEAWMTFALGIVALGSAHLLQNRWLSGAPLFVLGLATAGIVRPHIAGMAGLALFVSFLFRRQKRNLGELTPIAKTLKVAVIAVAALALFSIASSVFHGVDIGAGINSALEQTAERTEIGGSQFEAPVLTSPANLPKSIFTVLFRPHPLEADNTQALLAAVEATFLLIFSIYRFRWLGSAIRSVRRQPYVGLAVVFTCLFIFAFSAFGNFGLLARQRVQLLPFYLVLFSLPPRPATPDDRASSASSHASRFSGTRPSVNV